MVTSKPAPVEPKKAEVDLETGRRIAALEQKLAEEQKRAAERERPAAEEKQPEQSRKTAPAAKPRAEPPKPVARPAPEPVTPKIAAPEKTEVATVAPPPPPDPMASAERDLADGNYSAAASKFRPLAERGNTSAMVKLGDLYLAGQGVERSDELALRMYRGASDRGNADAHQRLGDLYAKGRGVPQNNFQAFAYYTAALQSGNAAAKASADRAASTLQPVEVQQALKLAERIGRSKER